MDRRTLDVGLPMLYALVMVVCSLWAKGAVSPVAIIGAILLGGYYAIARPKLVEQGGEGRERNR
jgi:hypothetical protein